MKINQTLLTLFAAGATIIATASIASAQVQRLANPSYFYPGALWTQLESAAPRAGLAIMNPNSGSGASLNTDYVRQVKEAQADGIKVVGYVDTAYGKRSQTLVDADIDNYVNWYHVDGIMFDEASNLEADLPYYKTCFNYVRSKSPHGLVILNPGAPTFEDYMSAADIIITFESPFADYQTNFVQSPWVTKYPASRFWHIILGATSESDMLTAVRESKARHAGWVYVTSYVPPVNPYDKLPADPYWSDELKALAAAN